MSLQPWWVEYVPSILFKLKRPEWYTITTTQDNVMINISSINDALDSVMLVDAF